MPNGKKKLGQGIRIVQITGLDITLRRMQAIENRFNELSSFGAQLQSVDSDFQKMLDASMSKASSANDTPFKDKVFSSLNRYGSTSPEEIDELIATYSAKNNLDKDFVKALIKQESGFQTDATSHCGAMGLMQLMPSTADSMGVKNAYDAEQNIAGGTKYLKGLMDRFDGNMELALAAYNAGPGAVQKYGGIPPYKETQNYVKNVLSNYQKYSAGGQN